MRCSRRSSHRPRSISWSAMTSLSYYSEHPAGSFALQVWINNSWVSAQCIAFSILLGILIPLVAVRERRQSGVIAGLMFQADKADLFGLTDAARAAGAHRRFLAGAVGMRLGWTGDRSG